MNKQAAIWIGLASLFGTTTGLILPWLISNDVLPMPLILFGMFCVCMFWFWLLQKPALRLIKYLNKIHKGTDK